MRAGAGKAERDERRGYFGGRAKRAGREFEDKLWPRVELGSDGKIAVIFVAGLRGEAEGHFQLDDDVDFVDLIGEGKETVENRRSDVVGKIAIEADAPSGCKRAEVGFEHITGDDSEIRVLIGETLQPLDESRIKLDSVDGNAATNQIFGHFPMACANFNPAVIWSGGICGTFHAVRGNANRAGDFFTPAGIAQEMLSKFLSGHECVIPQSISSSTPRGRLGRLDERLLRQQSRLALCVELCVADDSLSVHTLAKGNRS